MFLQFTFPNTLPRRTFCCQTGRGENRRVITSPILKVLNSNFSAATAECKVIWSELRQPVSVRIVGTYRFTGALDTVHDAEGFPQIWVPRVLQRVKPASERAS